MEGAPKKQYPEWIESLPTEERGITKRVCDIWALAMKAEGDDGEHVMDLVVDYTDRLRAKNIPVREYRLFHALIGSGPGRELEHFDFDGEDSVVHFVETELLPLTKKNT